MKVIAVLTCLLLVTITTYAEADSILFEKYIFNLRTDQGESENKPIKKILLIGDSFMQGYGPSFKALFSKRGIIAIDASKPSTGLVIINKYYWPEEFPRLLDKHSPQLVICSMGANDTQGMRLGKKVLAFGNREWINEYGERVKHFLILARKKEARFIWLGLPQMRSPAYDRKVRVVNEICKKVIEENGGLFISTNNLLENNGISVDQKEKRRSSIVVMRNDDGIHYSMKGYQKITNAVVQQLSQMHEL